jgi:hypothetical protein
MNSPFFFVQNEHKRGLVEKHTSASRKFQKNIKNVHHQLFDDAVGFRTLRAQRSIVLFLIQTCAADHSRL